MCECCTLLVSLCLNREVWLEQPWHQPLDGFGNLSINCCHRNGLINNCNYLIFFLLSPIRITTWSSLKVKSLCEVPQWKVNTFPDLHTTFCHQRKWPVYRMWCVHAATRTHAHSSTNTFTDRQVQLSVLWHNLLVLVCWQSTIYDLK